MGTATALVMATVNGLVAMAAGVGLSLPQLAVCWSTKPSNNQRTCSNLCMFSNNPLLCNSNRFTPHNLTLPARLGLKFKPLTAQFHARAPARNDNVGMLNEETYAASPQSLETVMAILYRLASYTNTHLIDDAAILALIFC